MKFSKWIQILISTSSSSKSTPTCFLVARGKRKRDEKTPEKIQKVTENGNAPSPKKNMVSFGDSSTKSQIEQIDDSTENRRYL